MIKLEKNPQVLVSKSSKQEAPQSYARLCFPWKEHPVQTATHWIETFCSVAFIFY